ncbi:MAG: hypothetical protein WB697_11110 [Stellaceae bacterium]
MIEVNKLRERVARYQSIADRTYDYRTAGLLRTIIRELQREIEQLELIVGPEPAMLEHDREPRG